MSDFEIRVWDRLDKVMHFGVLDLTPYVDSPRYEVMLSISLRDKWNKPIFEKDLISDQMGTMAVVWSDNAASWFFKAKDLHGSLTTKRAAKCEIVGNVYESPDLCQL